MRKENADKWAKANFDSTQIRQDCEAPAAKETYIATTGLINTAQVTYLPDATKDSQVIP
jgi:hypothetical protein